MRKEELVASLKKSGFATEIVNAFANISREDFVPEAYQAYAYVDGPLPIGEGATISQPRTIACMLEWLEINDKQRILEIGSGSGYVLALMNEIANNLTIFGVEINESLVKQSRDLFNNDNITIQHGNGFYGLPEQAPFDRILVSAAFQNKPEHLFEQLTDNGILICPVKTSIFKFIKQGDKITEQVFPGFAFVTMQEEK